MRQTFALPLVFTVIFPVILPNVRAADRTETKDYPNQPVPFTKVHFRDAFWLPRIETNSKAAVPFAFKQSEDTNRIDYFKVAAKLSDKRGQSDLDFNDSDTWNPVQNFSDCAVSLNAFNSVSFIPVMSDALRLEVTFRENFSSGIQE